MNGRKSSNHCRLNPRYLFSYTKVAVPMARNLFRVPVIYGFPLDNIMQWCSSFMLDNNRPIQKEAGHIWICYRTDDQNVSHFVKRLPETVGRFWIFFRRIGTVRYQYWLSHSIFAYLLPLAANCARHQAGVSIYNVWVKHSKYSFLSDANPGSVDTLPHDTNISTYLEVLERRQCERGENWSIANHNKAQRANIWHISCELMYLAIMQPSLIPQKTSV